ncbi:DUF6503 family protein [Winogradskyella sp.]|uniref:DUF6503 family protein n=1 Tax=Winogradskyella sp. TaxID=1883156 RepID=UPI0025DF6065|nr:DUF6503 family protein [Winogradskyella sp.]
MKYLSFIIIALSIASCKNEPEAKSLSADEIINKSIEVSGGEKFERSAIDFDFRGKIYTSTREKGKFTLSRTSIEADSIFIIDHLNNEGYSRQIGKMKTNGLKTIVVEDSMAVKYIASVNSVHYFSTLPYGLNDKAVNKSLLNEERIKNKDYYKIKVTFNEEGGGEDYEDVFVYWIDKELFKLDYLAYSYNEDDGVGMRFREVYNERYVNGLRFVDYNNYKAENTKIKLTELGKAFEANQLKLLSKIELENVKVDLIND